EAARNIVCSGGKPLAITNCLNFGNPYKPEVYWVFKEAVTGMGEACRLFNTPVTGGNVSFYNENQKGAVFPTPTIGMLGLVEDIQQDTVTFPFKNEGNLVVYLGAPRLGLGGSEYLSWIHDKTVGDAPNLDLAFEKHLQDGLLAMIHRGWIKSAHDVSDGGLAITLAEMALFSGLGAELDLEDMEGTLTEILFSEAQSGIVIEITPENWDDFEGFCLEEEIPMQHLGEVGGESLNVEGVFRIPVSQMKEIYESVIPDMMQPSR
ncbi:MAG TPA: AIR synthase-related protein, partial [Balneolales bacterium]|nr:AIR synthase-related protein [Balneolales bacterium]